MTREEHSDLHHALKRAGGRCLPVGDALERWLIAHPHVPREEGRRMALLVGRVPWPSVEGNPPVFRDRPFYDARFYARERLPDPIFLCDDNEKGRR